MLISPLCLALFYNATCRLIIDYDERVTRSATYNQQSLISGSKLFIKYHFLDWLEYTYSTKDNPHIEFANNIYNLDAYTHHLKNLLMFNNVYYYLLR